MTFAHRISTPGRLSAILLVLLLCGFRAEMFAQVPLPTYAPYSTQADTKLILETEPPAGFGQVIEMEEDLLVISAPFEKFDGKFAQGAVYVYRHTRAGWILEARLTAEADADEGDHFGRDVAMERGPAGTFIAVSAFEEEAVYIFEHSDGIWTRTQRIASNAGRPIPAFGIAIDLDGPWLVIGDTDIDPSGGVYVYERNEEGRYEEVALLKSNDVIHFMGRPLQISDDRIVVSTSGFEPYFAKVYSYVYQDGTWTNEGLIDTPSSVQTNTTQMALNGPWLAMQATRFDVGPSDEAVYLFHREGGHWEQVARLGLPIQNSGFGSALALADGWLGVGAPLEDDYTGAVYIYLREDGKWIQKAKFTATESQHNDFLGYYDMAISETYTVASSARTDLETVYLFDIDEAVASEEPAAPPSRAVLEGAYSNPFRNATTLMFSLPSPRRVRLVIYDMTGREVATVVEGMQFGGEHRLRWEPNNLASGVYLAVLHIEGHRHVQALIYTR